MNRRHLHRHMPRVHWMTLLLGALLVLPGAALPQSSSPAGERAVLGLADVLEAYEGSCAKLLSFDVVVRTKWVARASNANPKSDERTSRQIYSDGQFRADLVAIDGTETTHETRRVWIWNGERESYLNMAQGQLQFHPDPVSDAGIYHLGWSRTFRDRFPGYSFARIFRTRETTMTSLENGLYEIVAPPKAEPGGVAWKEGVRAVLDSGRGFMPISIETLVPSEEGLRVDDRIENELVEVSNGIWAPLYSRRISYDGPTSAEVFGYYALALDLSRSRFNEPIEESRFQLNIHRDIAVFDFTVDPAEMRRFRTSSRTE